MERVSKAIVNRRREVSARLSHIKRPSEILEYVQNYMDIQDGISTSALATCLTKLLDEEKWEGGRKEEGKARLLCKLLLGLINEHVDQMGPRQISNCMWSLGKAEKVLELQDNMENFGPVYDKLSKRAVGLSLPRQEITSQTMANILWSMARVKWQPDGDFQLVVKKSISYGPTLWYKPQEVSNILWAMGTQNHRHVQHVKYFVEHLKNKFHLMAPQERSISLWAMRKLRYYDEEIFHIAVESLLNKQFVPEHGQQVCNVAMFFVFFGYSWQGQGEQRNQVMEVLVENFLQNAFTFGQSQANFLYALSLLKCPIKLAQKVADTMYKYKIYNYDRFKVQSFVQVRRAQLEYKVRGENLVVDKELQQRGLRHTKLGVFTFSTHKKQFQNVLFEQIQKRYKNSKKNYAIFGKEILIDIAIFNKDLKLAIFAVKSDFFALNKPEFILGNASALIDLVQCCGWQVIDVWETKWDDIHYQEEIFNKIDQELQI